ncbi:MAG TPA: thrombospondin type 3 repeat-containing protein [Mycobacteriales bacterium]|nr:thrombospondin type 3 repeat-containing protein [Mycobacteriales bacterium]
MIAGRRLLVASTIAAVLTGGLTGVVTGVARAAPGPVGLNAPSALCHITDGSFSRCPDGSAEWSDVTPAPFDTSGAFLYSDQADLDPDLGIPGSPVDTLMLMYDECGTTRPLGTDEYFLVSFDTIEGGQGEPESVERYNIHIFTDGTIVFLLNGVAQTDQAGNARVTEIDGQQGRAGFGQSPKCQFNHLVVEYQVRLSAASVTGLLGTGRSGPTPAAVDQDRDGYSPDPLFWGGTPRGGGNNPPPGDLDRDKVGDEVDNCPTTPNTDQKDSNLDGIGDACESPDQQHATAAFVQAQPDGQTGVEPTGTGVTDEPSLTDRLVRVVQFRTTAGLTDSPTTLTDNLVNSLVHIGLVAPQDAATLERAVLRGLDQAPSCAGVRADRSALWPPNHQRAAVAVSGATDPDPGDTVSLAIDAVSQDEPVTGTGSGRTGPDGGLTDPMSGSAWVRAERDRTGDGRVYRLHVTATDQAGLTCQAVVTVSVPRDRRHPATDSAAASYDSLVRPGR